MRFQSDLVAMASAVWASLASPVQAQTPLLRTGLLSLIKDATLFNFQYSVEQANSANWVGLYHSSGGGPINEEKVSPSVVWTYAPNGQDIARLPTDGLEPGNYTAYFLANGGYKWLAEPVDVFLARETGGDIAFITSDVVLPNARVDDAYSHRISGFVKGDSGPVTFSTNGSEPEWLQVSSDGVLSGTPDSEGEVVVSVQAATSQSSASATFKIPVRPSGSSLVEQLSILTINLWHGGTQVNNYHDKQVRFLAGVGADVIGIQEDQDGRHLPRLANALGWHYWSGGGDLGVLSKYPIAQEYGEMAGGKSAGVRIALDGDDRQINFYNVHLGYDPYGPYDFCFYGMSFDQVMQREEISGRTPQIKTTLAGMDANLAQADDVPVLLVGDFNAPSHLDWVDALAEKNCGVSGVRWPTSVLTTETGLVDSFRVANPDPVEVQGITWSTVSKVNGDRPEPQDRIDFIYHKGESLRVVDSRTVVVGEPRPSPDYKDNEWTSDHFAVLTTYEFN